MDVPTYHKVLIVTDAAINIAPTLEDKVDICPERHRPRPSRSGVERAEGGHPGRGRDRDLEDARHHRRRRPVQDGRARTDHRRAPRRPPGFRQRHQPRGRRTKGITSEVAGDPDILLAPDLEAGNILAKQLSFLANADSAGLVLGARVPIILTSRADSVRARIASCGVAMLAAHARRRQGRRRVRMDDYALVLNAGSSSLKFCVYRRPEGEAWRLEARGQIEGSGRRPASPSRTARARRLADQRLDARCATAGRALDALAGWLRSRMAARESSASATASSMAARA